MSREPVCPSCGARLRGFERPCPQCGSRSVAPSQPIADLLAPADLFVALTADEPARIKGLLDRLVAAGIEFEPIGDLQAELADVEPDVAGGATLVSVRVRRSDLDRARAVEAEWMEVAHPDAVEPLQLEGNAAESCPACDAFLTREAERCPACGFELPPAESAS